MITPGTFTSPQFISHDWGTIDGPTRRLSELRLIMFNIELKKKRTFRKFSYRGIDLDQYATLAVLYTSLPLTNVPQDSSTSLQNSSVM